MIYEANTFQRQEFISKRYCDRKKKVKTNRMYELMRKEKKNTNTYTHAENK